MLSVPHLLTLKLICAVLCADIVAGSGLARQEQQGGGGARAEEEEPLGPGTYEELCR